MNTNPKLRSLISRHPIQRRCLMLDVYGKYSEDEGNIREATKEISKINHSCRSVSSFQTSSEEIRHRRTIYLHLHRQRKLSRRPETAVEGDSRSLDWEGRAIAGRWRLRASHLENEHPLHLANLRKKRSRSPHHLEQAM